ncbi:hypothetical protein [Sorangium sp. So ce124]|uniref:hypothetical protein n=1 Tax=Sorangium sp. So ce124 TaxID=3133280 RepID=UPI003F600760
MSADQGFVRFERFCCCRLLLAAPATSGESFAAAPVAPAARHGAVPIEEQKPLRRRAERTARARLKGMLRAPGEARVEGDLVP